MPDGALIGGVYYGLHNIGDEAILLAMVREFAALGPLSVMTYGSTWLDQLPLDVARIPIVETYGQPKLGVFVEPRRSIRSIARSFVPDLAAYKGKSVYICGGATTLSDCPWHTLRTVKFAAAAGVPSVLWGVGMAASSDSTALAFVADTCNSQDVRRVYVRDRFVQARLHRAGVDPHKVEVVYDPAIMLSGCDFDLSRYLDQRATDLLLDDAPNVCVSVSGEDDVVARTPLPELTSYVRWLLTELGARVFLVPTGCGEHCRDRALLGSIARDTGAVLLDREFHPDELVSFLAHMRLVTSSRLHANILAAAAGVPSIGLARNEKLQDFADLIGAPCLPLSGLTSNDLIEATVSVMSQHEEHVRNLAESVERMRRTHAAAAARVVAEFAR